MPASLRSDAIGAVDGHRSTGFLPYVSIILDFRIQFILAGTCRLR